MELNSEIPVLQLPRRDNTPTGLRTLLRANEQYRVTAWPAPFRLTRHRLHLGDSRDLSWLPNESVHLVVTSPPYWTLKRYRPTTGQLGHIENYETFLTELDTVWAECARLLV